MGLAYGVSYLSSAAIGRASLAAALLVTCLVVPAGAGAAVAPDGSAEPLPNFDSRDLDKPAESEAKAQARLARSLGPEGFADAGGQLGGLAFVGRTDGYLTGASDASARQTALAFVGKNQAAFGLSDADLADLELSDSYTSKPDGVRHLTFEQMVGGYPSFDTWLIANVSEQGRLINVSGSPEGGLTLDDPDPELSAKQALAAAREDVGGEAGGGFGPQESAELVAFPKPDGSAELAYDVYADSTEGFLYQVVIGADSGEVLARRSKTEFANQADVFPRYPDQTGTPTRVNLGSPDGGRWINDTAGNTRLAGNNAHAYADINNNNVADGGENVPQSGGDWLFPYTYFNHAECPAFGCTWDSTNAATQATNQNASVTQMFYLTNLFHDHLLASPIGFDEASRNFEQVNESGMGLGNDRVLAEGSDGGGTNNANFATPADGSAPRMQMYLFNSDWDVNGTDDAEIVYHEYAHGLTNRLVNNGSGLTQNQSRAMGEGWSDWYAQDFLVGQGAKTDGPGEDLTMGGYSIDLFGVGGIRRQRMDCKPASAATFCPAYNATGTGGFTFGDMGQFPSPNGVHDNGEIWSQTLWDLREAIGVNDARAVVTGGLRLSPVGPSFLQMRDAILQSANTLGMNVRAIWQVFADRGMGYSASTPGASVFSATEAFDVPPRLALDSTNLDDSSPLGDGDGALEPGETMRITDSLTNPAAEAATNVRGEMTTSSPVALVGESKATWPNFPASVTTQAADDPFTVTIPSSASCDGSVDLATTLTFDGGTVNLPDRSFDFGVPTFQSASPGTAIPDNNPTGVNVTMTLPSGTISDMDVRLDSITHTWVGDLKMTLTSPGGTSVVLMNRPGAGGNGSSGDNFTNTVLDDEADTPIEAIGPTGPFTGSWRPDEPLSAFDGQERGGTWTLNVSDNAGADLGTINTWSLATGRDCSTTAPELPTATSEPATGITTSSATLNSFVDPNGTATSYAFEYGTTTAYGTRTTPGDAGNGTDPTLRSDTISGLNGSQTYHFRALALRDGVVVAVGPDQSFTTAAPDTTPPVTTIDSGPSGTTSNNDPSFGFSSNESGSTFECRLDGPGGTTGTFSSCSSPKGYTDLADGDYTFMVRATDAASNLGGVAERSFTVDTAGPGDTDPPETTLTKTPKKKVKSKKKKKKVTFEFISDEPGTFTCKLDAAPAQSCTSPFSKKVKKGRHTFSVFATDEAGNADPTPAQYSFKVKRKKRRR